MSCQVVGILSELARVCLGTLVDRRVLACQWANRFRSEPAR